MIQRGELTAFRLGEKLVRIPAEAVEEFERASRMHPPAFTAPTPPKPKRVNPVTRVKLARLRSGWKPT
jgi:hypothetical protein